MRLDSSLEVEQQESTEAQNPLDVKGGDQPQSFVVSTMSSIHAGGLPPITEYNSWVRDLGKSMPFILGNRIYGPVRSILMKVDITNAVFGPTGEMMSCDLSLEFMEDKPLSVTGKDVKEGRKGPSKGEKKAKKGSMSFAFTDADRAEAKKLQKEAGIK
ncbi:hypothetical protein [Akkermansia sp.]|uniref:hypothetical protein n=1 Tax=Akkermansia sp. TaxID=1872421 RepID=UPI0025BF01C8|nr:hypothetical protein [Akkermansia sp.]MCC8147989.1 hypothetical protein [Akkermansia sp.]